MNRGIEQLIGHIVEDIFIYEWGVIDQERKEDKSSRGNSLELKALVRTLNTNVDRSCENIHKSYIYLYIYTIICIFLCYTLCENIYKCVYIHNHMYFFFSLSDKKT